jgi:hypothetical protein
MMFADISVGNVTFVFDSMDAQEVEDRLVEFEQSVQLHEGLLLRAFKDAKTKTIVYFAAIDETLDTELLENNPIFQKKHSCVEKERQGDRFILYFQRNQEKCKECTCLLSPFTVLGEYKDSKTGIVCVFHPEEIKDPLMTLLQAIRIK